MQHYLNEQNIFIFLVQMFLLLAMARGLGILFSRHHLPAVTAEILVGILLGPTVLGKFWPSIHQMIFPPNIIQVNMLETVGWLGVLFLLLQSGLEIDFTSAWRQRGDALVIAVFGVIVPMLIAFFPSLLVPDQFLVDPQKRILFALFMATAMSISALPVAARVLHDLRLSKTDLGFLIMSAFSVNDVIGWLIFTMILGFCTHAMLDISTAVFIFSATIGFTVLCLTLGRSFVVHILAHIHHRQMPEPGTSLTFLWLLGVACGALTQKIGIHALFGFFIAGIMAGGARTLSERTRQIIAQLVYSLFVPLFFAGIGLKIDFLRNFNVYLAGFVTVIGILGRFMGAWIGAKLSRTASSNHLAIAIAHTPGGTMEIVIGILALEYGLITKPVFVAIVFGALVSSITLGPWLSYAMKKRKHVSILEYFLRRGIVMDLKTDNRDSAIYKLCEAIVEQEEILDVDAIYAAVLHREEAMGTALEKGVAVPHARIAFLKRPVVIFGKSPAGIEWNSPDGIPTHFIFLILTPVEGDDVQVQVLAQIARAMNDDHIQNAIDNSHDTNAVWQVFEKAFTKDRD